MPREPAFLTIACTKLAMAWPWNHVYRDFADRLPLHGAETVLDFGCGAGTVAYHTARHLPAGKLICLELSSRWLKACQIRLKGRKNVDFILGDIRETALPAVDIAYCHFVLHELPAAEMEATVGALADTVKTQGFLLFREPLRNAKKIRHIEKMLESRGFQRRLCRIIDVPWMGSTLECTFEKSAENGGTNQR